jgi:hypothetical protein
MYRIVQFVLIIILTLQHVAGCFCQQKILLIGTFHQTPTEKMKDIDVVAAAVKNFSPEIICVEYRISTDTISQRNSYVDERFEVVEKMREAQNLRPDSITRKIRTLINDADLHADATKWMKLCDMYFLSHDFANADYQAYLLLTSLANDTAKESYLKRRFTSFKRIRSLYDIKTSRHDEYASLVFPLANNLGVSYLYPIDDLGSWRTYEKYYDLLQKRETIIPNRQGYYRRIDNFRKKIESLPKETNTWVYVNSPEQIDDLLYVEAYKIDETNSEEIKMLSHYWVLRNRIIAEHIRDVAKLHPGKNIAVFFGASHVGPVREELNKLNMNFSVLTLLDVMIDK